ncbi:MAG: tRNA lysidine(34) synthetase TilS [Pirellulales bacterium]
MNLNDLSHRLFQVMPIEQWQCQRIVLAVSGGADSVALLRLVQQSVGISQNLLVAHFNHGWRDAESDADQQFVESLTQSLGVACATERAVCTTESRSEQTARNRRYAFLQRVAAEHQANFIATAHTASDRVETMLHNLCRGTGLSGMCSLAETRKLVSGVTLIRPLWHCYREEILGYLRELGQVYREDSSNSNEHYRRNFLRHSVLPLLRKTYGEGVDKRLVSFSELAEETVQLQHQQCLEYGTQVASLISQAILAGRLFEPSSEQLFLPCRQLLPHPWPIVLNFVQQGWQERGWSRQAMGRKHWERLRQAWQRVAVPKRPKRTLRPKSLFQLPGCIDIASCNGWITLASGSNGNSKAG